MYTSFFFPSFAFWVSVRAADVCLTFPLSMLSFFLPPHFSKWRADEEFAVSLFIIVQSKTTTAS